MVYVGIDVSKGTLDLGVLDPSGSTPPTARRVAHTPDGIAALVAELGTLAPHLVVVEATGAYHQPLLAAVLAAGLAVSVVNPVQVAAFRTVGLGRTKTDRQDALLLARFAATDAPQLRRAAAAWPLQAELRALMRLREDLVLARTRLAGHQEAADYGTHALTQALLAEQDALLVAQLARVEAAVKRLVAQLPEARVVQTVCGIGLWTAASVLAELPAALWGQVKPAAAYLGVHPAVRQSGQGQTSHLSKAGPGSVRRVLYMAAMTAVQCDPAMRARYDRLVAAGKPPMVALCAVMHALVRHMMGALRAYYRTQQPSSDLLAA